MLLSDQAKLVLLLGLTAACLSTIFFSPSTTMHNSNMKVLSPPLQQFCKAAGDAVKECQKSKESSGNQKMDCASLETHVANCEKTVRRAFRDINLGGCPFPIKSLTLCEDEWCRGRSDPTSCAEECSGVREQLSSCIQQHVSRYFEWAGLQNDGTAT